MLCAHRLSAVRPCLLFLAAVLANAIMLASGASAGLSRAAVTSVPAAGASAPAVQSVSKQPRRRKVSSARQPKCAPAARTEKVRKACAVERTKAKVTKPSAPPKLAATAPLSSPFVAVTSAPAPTIAGAPLAVPAQESTPPAESPGGSDKSPAEPPVEPKSPVELKAPIEPISPVEESKPSAEEPKPLTTTTTLASSGSPSQVGHAVTYTATIDPAAATGTVAFKEAGTTLAGCGAQVISSGSATCPVASYTAAGVHAITATYSGNADVATSVSSIFTQTVNPTGTGKTAISTGETATVTTTVVSSSPNPSTAGQNLTYTATVNPVTATGVIEFKQAGTAIAGCGAQPMTSGSASCVTSGTAAGSHSITARYAGDSEYAPSTAPTLTQVVDGKATTGTLTSSLNPSTVGQAVTYTVKISPAVATGVIEFKQAGTAIAGCGAQSMTSGSASCVTSGTAAGSHSITARYAGNSEYAPSTTSTLTQIVNKKATTTTVSSSLDPSAVGEAVTYTATVNPATATGTIEFKGGAALAGCGAQAIVSGSATCTVAGYQRWSSYAIAAAYSGGSFYLASTSSILTQTVNPPNGAGSPFRFFSPTSFWNETLPESAPLDPNSAAVVSAFADEVTEAEDAKAGPSINTTLWSVPVYTVPADQPTVKVTLERLSPEPALQSAWNAVPLPADAQPAAGTDKHLVVWQPDTDRLWEFWHLENTPTGWQAQWGGAMENALSDVGAYGPNAWSGATASWGSSATSLSVAGGLITLEDLEKGEINHALAIAIPNPRGGVYTTPAERTDGESTNPLSLPEGAHLRLDPHLNLTALHLPRLTLMMAEAAQRYGIVVRDHAANVAFFGQDPTPTGSNPYTEAPGYFEGKAPHQLLESFPWSHLQLLKLELHSTS
jgi:hypothetical protein